MRLAHSGWHQLGGSQRGHPRPVVGLGMRRSVTEPKAGSTWLLLTSAKLVPLGFMVARRGFYFSGLTGSEFVLMTAFIALVVVLGILGMVVWCSGVCSVDQA